MWEHVQTGCTHPSDSGHTAGGRSSRPERRIEVAQRRVCLAVVRDARLLGRTARLHGSSCDRRAHCAPGRRGARDRSEAHRAVDGQEGSHSAEGVFF